MAKPKAPKAAERRSKNASKIDAIMAEIAKLGEFEREELLERIDEEYPYFDPSEVPAQHIEILKTRLAHAKANPDDHIPLEEHLKIFEKYR